MQLITCKLAPILSPAHSDDPDYNKSACDYSRRMKHFVGGHYSVDWTTGLTSDLTYT